MSAATPAADAFASMMTAFADLPKDAEIHAIATAVLTGFAVLMQQDRVHAEAVLIGAHALWDAGEAEQMPQGATLQ